MLPIEKNNEIKQKLNLVLQRVQRLKSTQNTFFDYVIKTNNLQKTYAKKIWNSMTDFQEKIVKITFYSSEKVKLILNFTKIYREFAIHWQKISKVNIKNLEQITGNVIEVSQKQVQQKSKLFFEQLHKYQSEQKIYNAKYTLYQKMCFNLNEDIQKFKSYSDPLRFYNEKVTSQFLQNLNKKYEKCNTQQTHLITQIQMLDQKRNYLSQSLGQVKQEFVPTFKKFLKNILTCIKYIVDPSKDQAIQKQDFKLKKSQDQQNKYYNNQVQNLLITQTKQNTDQNQNILMDFKELFNSTQLINNEITSDQKFFYDRCQNIKNKKIKRTNQIMNIQKLLINELNNQMSNLKNFQIEFKKNQKEIFGSDGLQSYKKKFKKYFGKNFNDLFQLCVTISQTRRHSIEKIYKIMQSWQQKNTKAYESKKQSIKIFDNKSKLILQTHKKIKQKVQNINTFNASTIQQFKSNVIKTYEQFSKNYKDLQTNQIQMDKSFFKSLKQISDVILKQAINKSLLKIIEKQKNRMQILKKLNVNNQAQQNFYIDPKYQIFFSQQITANLNKKFKSIINQKQFQQTRKTLLSKQQTLKGMITHKITCCGTKSIPKTSNLKQSFECYLIVLNQNKCKVKGVLNILSNGINFCQKSWNPFSSLLQIIVPNKDLQSYKIQVLQEIQVLTVITKKGSVYFMGDQIKSILQSMIKYLGLINTQKQGSDKNARNNISSSSSMNGSRSRSFRIQFQNKSTSTSIHRYENNNSPLKKKLTKNSLQDLNNQQLMKKIKNKLFNDNFFSKYFTPIQKQLPIKDNQRFNYNYKKDYHKFLLKQKKRCHLQGNILSFDYSWKVSFPQNTMLQSFKHYETVYVELLKQIVKIEIVHGVNIKDVSLAQKIFYDQIQQMNKRLSEYIVQYTQRSSNVVIRPDQQSDLQSLNFIDQDKIEINIIKKQNYQSIQKNLLNTDNFNFQTRNSKFQRSLSIMSNNNKSKA